MRSNARSKAAAQQIPLPILLWATGSWWVVAMDGGQARLFVRQGRNSAFAEHSELLADEHGRPIEPVEGGHHHGRYEKTERQFVQHIARRLETLASQGRFDHLAVFAAPIALGVLRPAMGPMTVSRLRYSNAADIVGEPTRHILERLGG